jgi:hypothetical protein
MGIEAALLGAPLLSSTAGASTVGLLGAGGTFSLGAGSLGGMLGTLGTGLSLFSGLSSVMGGMQSNAEAKNQANLALSQANMRGAEQGRLAAKEALAEQEASDAARKRQKVAYLASGVSLAGSPLLVMEETRKKGLENVNEILKAGSAAESAIQAEGRIQADQLKSSGRQAFAQGITGGLSTISRALV